VDLGESFGAQSFLYVRGNLADPQNFVIYGLIYGILTPHSQFLVVIA
jgi:hypothetical protein